MFYVGQFCSSVQHDHPLPCPRLIVSETVRLLDLRKTCIVRSTCIVSLFQSFRYTVVRHAASVITWFMQESQVTFERLNILSMHLTIDQRRIPTY